MAPTRSSHSNGANKQGIPVPILRRGDILWSRTDIDVGCDFSVGMAHNVTYGGDRSVHFCGAGFPLYGMAFVPCAVSCCLW